uniref:(northern house mosquito) hypothetical protein n=1 Tax=Culex pipiens TaxID=7175 RepID=A0A8D8BH40_CULPI
MHSCVFVIISYVYLIFNLFFFLFIPFQTTRNTSANRNSNNHLLINLTHAQQTKNIAQQQQQMHTITQQNTCSIKCACVLPSVPEPLSSRICVQIPALKMDNRSFNSGSGVMRVSSFFFFFVSSFKFEIIIFYLVCATFELELNLSCSSTCVYCKLYELCG